MNQFSFKGKPLTVKPVQEKSLVQLSSNIQAEHVVFKKLRTYSMFDVVRRDGNLYFYLSDGEKTYRVI